MIDSKVPIPKLFRSEPGNGNVLPNRSLTPEVRLPIFARKFHEAGKLLAASMLSKGGYNDIDACPIVFLYRHAVELYLKAVVRYGVNLSDFRGQKIEVDEGILFGHPLLPLLSAFRRVFEAVGWTWESDVEGLSTYAEFEELIREVDEIDRRSFAFRYPMRKDGEDSLPPRFVMNIPEFCRLMDAILGNLDGAATQLGIDLEAYLDAASELGAENVHGGFP
jgi:hypothetical protein